MWSRRPFGGSNLLLITALSESPVDISPGDKLDFEWWPNIFLIGVKSFFGESIVLDSEPEMVCGGVKFKAFCGIWGDVNGVVLAGRGREWANSDAVSDVDESSRRWDLMSDRMSTWWAKICSNYRGIVLLWWGYGSR